MTELTQMRYVFWAKFQSLKAKIILFRNISFLALVSPTRSFFLTDLPTEFLFFELIDIVIHHDSTKKETQWSLWNLSTSFIFFQFQLICICAGYYLFILKHATLNQSLPQIEYLVPVCSEMAFPQTVPQQIHLIIHTMYTKAIYANIVLQSRVAILEWQFIQTFCLCQSSCPIIFFMNYGQW